MQRRVAKIVCFKCRVIRDFTILFVYPSILRKLRLTCRTQDAGARGWLGRRRGQDAGRTRALCGSDAGRVDARRGQTQCQVISWRYCSFKPLLFFILIVDTIMSVSRRTLNRLSTLSNQDIQRLATNISTTE